MSTAYFYKNTNTLRNIVITFSNWSLRMMLKITSIIVNKAIQKLYIFASQKVLSLKKSIKKINTKMRLFTRAKITIKKC